MSENKIRLNDFTQIQQFDILNKMPKMFTLIIDVENLFIDLLDIKNMNELNSLKINH